MNLTELQSQIDDAIGAAITARLRNTRGFREMIWSDWPGAKALSIVAAADVVHLLVTQKYLRNDAPSLNDAHDAAEARRTQELVAERISPTREDRAYQVLCALLSSPQNALPEAAVKISWFYVDLMEERGAQ